MKNSRGADRSDGGGGSFLFVNKTQKSKSLSKSDGAVAKLINRHAQHARTRKVEALKVNSARTNSSSARQIALEGWHRKAAGSSGDSSSPVSSPDETTPTTSLSHDPLSSASSSPPVVSLVDSRSSLQTSPRKPLPLHVLAGFGDPIPDDHEDEEALQLSFSSPIYKANFTAYDCVDPFGSTPVRITPKIHAVLQYSIKIYHYAGNNYKLAFLPKHVKSTISQFPIGVVVQRSVYREHHLYSLMAAMTARMKHTFGVTSTVDDPQKTCAAALRLVREELARTSRSGDIDTMTILDILFISVNQLQYRRYDDVRKHLQIVGKLLPLLDPNEHLDRWIAATAAHVDNQLALSTMRRPVLPSTFDPGPMLPERLAILRREAYSMRRHGYPHPTSLIISRESSSVSGLNDILADVTATLDVRMGYHFIEGLKMSAFSGKLRSIVSDLVDCIEIAKVVWLSPLAVCFDAEWLCRKARAVLRALLSLAPENNIGPPSLDAKCMECLRMSLTILMSHACTVIGKETAAANVQRLLIVQEAAFKYWCPSIGWSDDCIPLNPAARLSPIFEVQAGFVLWTTLLGSWVAEGLPEEEWFSRRAVNVSRYFGYTNYDDLHNHLSGYIYSKSMQESSLRRVGSRLQASIANLSE